MDKPPAAGIDVIETIAVLAHNHPGPKFLGIPDEWFEKSSTGFHWCPQGHRSTSYLKSERLGENVCFKCYEPTYFGPETLAGLGKGL